MSTDLNRKRAAALSDISWSLTVLLELWSSIRVASVMSVLSKSLCSFVEASDMS